MSYKLGLLLSLTFMMAVILLAGDLLNLSTIQSGLDALGTVVGYRLSSEGTVSDATKELVSSYGATLTFEEGIRPPFRIGDTVTFYLARDYEAFVISKQTMRVAIKRSAVVGYYMT